MSRRFVVGDIHGCYYTLQKLIEEKIQFTNDDLLFFLGDYIDRGPFSKDVVEYLIKLKYNAQHVYFIRGNHEDMFLKTLENREYLMTWMYNGAEETLSSFNIPVSFGYSSILLRSIPEEILKFIQEMPFYYELEDYIIVHAGLNFNSDNIFSDTESMLWTRNFTYNNEKAKNKIIIHGHTPIPLTRIYKQLEEKTTKCINLDAGCVYADNPGFGNLVALDLDSGKLYVQENIDF